MNTLSELEQAAFNYRGKIIDGCIEIEKSIETFISRYFTVSKTKQMEVVFLLLDRLSFDSKISVFQEILKQNHPGNYKANFDKLMSKIRMAKDHRNVFAHYLLKIDSDAVRYSNKQLSFFYLRNQPKYIDYTYSKIEDIITNISTIVTTIETMSKESSIFPSE